MEMKRQEGECKGERRLEIIRDKPTGDKKTAMEEELGVSHRANAPKL